jgi:hypothetical protein
MRIERYNGTRAQEWNDFISRSKNGTFLLLRDYMDYHADRFAEHSLFASSEKGELVAVLPAHQRGSTIASHEGLTYGGFISGEAMKLPVMLDVFEATMAYLRSEGIRELTYRTVPSIYHRVPAEEDRYALFLSGAQLTRRGVMTVVDRSFRLPFQERRKRGAKKARQRGVAISENENLGAYWELLTERLATAYAAQPVHTLGEIERLRGLFPGNIKLFTASFEARMVAGVVIHESDRVARAQYIASSPAGQELGALDLIFTELLDHAYAEKAYFDFGTSDEQNGEHVNRGLLDQKEGYGARVVVQDHYRLNVEACPPGRFLEALR